MYAITYLIYQNMIIYSINKWNGFVRVKSSKFWKPWFIFLLVTGVFIKAIFSFLKSYKIY